MTRKMKDSGIEWIGEIPEEWEVVALKYITSKIGSGKTPKGGSEIYSDKGVLFIRSQNVYDIGLKLDNTTFISERIDEDMKSTRVYYNDVLLNITGGSIGRSCLYKIRNSHANVNQHVCIIRAKSNYIIPKYINYFWISSLGKNSIYIFQSGANREGMNFEQISNTLIPYTNMKEQEKICDYLDNKCTKIDSTIEKENDLIEKLKEYKQSIITEAVTKGLNHDVPMKDSGVEWIGEIPEDWQCKKLKVLSKQIIDGTHNTPNYQSDGVPFLRVTDITNTEYNQGIDWKNTAYISEDEYRQLSKRCKPEKGDLLVSKNGTIGIPKVIDWDEKFNIFVSLCLIKVKKYVDVEFLYYYFKSSLIWTEIAIGGKTGTITNLHLDKIREFKVPIPDKQEQHQIASYLDKKCQAIDTLITKKQALITKLTEYKKSLIYECVTGKREIH